MPSPARNASLLAGQYRLHDLTLDQINWDYLLDTRLVTFKPRCRPGDPGDPVGSRAPPIPGAGQLDMNYRRCVDARGSVRHGSAHPVRRGCVSRPERRARSSIEGKPEEIVLQQGSTSAGHIVISLSATPIGWDRRTFHRQPAREVVILDRIGAGDAMVGGVLHGWLQGDFAKGLRYGALTAALALSQYGDQVITTSEELETLLETSSPDIYR
jgi:2-dehydro-3-deoxygluconokinase